jgi:hypothetical protein
MSSLYSNPALSAELLHVDLTKNGQNIPMCVLAAQLMQRNSQLVSCYSQLCLSSMHFKHYDFFLKAVSGTIYTDTKDQEYKLAKEYFAVCKQK